MARGSAVADYDNDGDLDVAINSIGGSAALLQNNATTLGNWLLVDAGSSVPGVRVSVTLPSSERFVRQQTVGSSYLASEDPRLHIGLGDAQRAARVVVTWPDGSFVELHDVPANQILHVQP